MKKIERNNIKLFSMGRFISLMGTFMYQFAAGLYVLQLTGSSTKFAITLIMGTLPRVIFAPLAGVLADRFNRKLIVVLTDLGSGFVLLLLLIWSREMEMTVGSIYFSMVALTIFNTFFDVAMEAGKPSLVDSETALEKINALSYGIQSFTSIVGPILGGLVYVLVSFKLFTLINGISFILSGCSELLLKFKQEKQIENEPFVEALQGGVKYLKENKFSIVLMSFSLSINFCLALSLTVPLPYLVNEVLLLDATWVGIVNAGFPIGYLLGTLIINYKGIKQRGRSLQRGIWFVWLSMAFITISVLLLSFIGSIGTAVIVTVFLATTGLSIAYIDIPLMTFLQMMIPSEVRGRVFSVMTMASRLAIPAAMLLSGQLLAVAHPGYLLLLGTGLYLLIILAVMRSVALQEYIETDTVKSVVEKTASIM